MTERQVRRPGRRARRRRRDRRRRRGRSGKALFVSNGCDGCHTFKPAGAKGTVGPDLDKLPDFARRAGKPLEQFIRESIVNPDAYVEPGYPKGVMPGTFASLPPAQLDALVKYLQGGRSERRRHRLPRARGAGRAPAARRAAARLPPAARAGLAARAWMIPLFFGIGAGIVVLVRCARGLAPDLERLGDHDRRADDGAARLPRRDRRLRLLGALRDRRADPARGPLRPRRPQLARLLPDQHRPQGDRDPVPGHDDRLLRDRRPAGDVHARRAGAAGDAVRRQPDLQRPLLGARGADDLPVRDPGLRRDRQLRDPADDRRAGHGLPAPERALVLAAADRRDHDGLELPRPRRRRSRPAGRTTRRSPSTSRSATPSSRWPCSGPARARS